MRRLLKACGCTVAERVPRQRKVTIADVERELGVAVLPKTQNFSAGLAEPDFPVLTQDRQDALKLTLAGLKAGAEARAKTWEADAKELLRVNESLVQVRNIGPGAKAE